MLRKLKCSRYFILLLGILLQSTILFCQGKKITGRITQSTGGQPLSGATITVKGTQTATVSDENGYFSISVPGTDAVLVITSVGYENVEISANREAPLNISLRETTAALDQIVVTGYTSQKKKDVTGSVAVVDMQELKSQPSASPVEALQGKATGVQIINDGSPGGTPQIRIRGFSTINNNDPLFIIDGMPYTGKLSWLSASDIESMQILKDASAASIYGSRANNGVVIITTRKGRKGPPKVSLETYYGTQSPNRSVFPDYLSPIQFAEYLYTAFRNAGQTPGLSGTTGSNYGSDPNGPSLPEYLLAGTATGQNVTPADADPSRYKYTRDAATFYQITRANQAGTNWFREITNNAPIQNYQLNIVGGGENASYVVSGGYFDQEGTIKHTGFRRYTVRANTNFTALNNRLTIGENMQYSYISGYGFATNPNVAGSYQGEGSPIGWAYRMQTIVPVYDIMGNFAGTKGDKLGNAENPLAVLYRNRNNKGSNNQFFGSAFADLKILNGLNIKTVYGIRYDNYRSISIGFPNPEFSEGSYNNNPLNETQGNANEWTWTNTLTYKNKFGGDDDLTLLAGTEAVKSQGRMISGTGNNFFVFGDMNYYYLDAASAAKSSSGNGFFSSLFSLFARADYAFMDRYLLSATIRRDGSSNFGINNRFGNFPAGSIAWRISEENFMADADWITDLKVRVGYGTTGNQNIPSFQYLRQYQSAINTSNYPVGGRELASGIWTSNYDNPNVKWEGVKAWNAGIDFAILANKLDGSIDWYNKKTSDMLYPVPLPAQGVGGGASPFVNIGAMTNRGVEVSLNYHHNEGARHGQFKFDAGVNVSRNVNELVALAPTVKEQQYGSFRSITTSILRAGEPFGAFYGFKVAGIYQNQDEVVAGPSYEGARVGGQKYTDISGPKGTPDGIIDNNDRTIIGSPHPDFIYSLSFNASFKNFDLFMFFNGSEGNDIFDATRYYTDFNAFDGAVSTRMLNAWSPTNTTSKIPAPYRNPNALELASNSYYIQDGSYFRMKNLQIGYNFQGEKMFNGNINSLRLYISGSNLFTITKYTGLDPEVTQFSSTFSAPGVDLGMYPASRQYLVGLNVIF